MKKRTRKMDLSPFQFSRQLQLEELEDRRLLSAGVAKNVILMIADGQGFNSVRATDYWAGSPAVYESFDVKYAVRTTSATGLADGYGYSPALMASDFNNAKDHGATDSAAAATAMYTGQKVYDLGINWSTGNQPLTTFFERVAQHGKSIGAVSTVQISNATPAAVFGHNRSRTDYVNLAQEAVYGRNPVAANNDYDAGNYNGNLKVVMGAGHPDYNDNGVSEPAVTDEWVGGTQAWTDLGNGVNGWTRVDTAAAIQDLASGATPDKVFGIARVNETFQAYRDPTRPANDKTLPYADPQTAGLPTLEDLTRAALNVLDNNPNGFAVMIEGGAVDWANHARLIGRLIEEETDFNNSVQAVVDYLDANTNGNNWDNTLLIVTADHETGYLWGDGSSGSTFFDVNGNGMFDSGTDYAHVKNNGQGQLPSVWYFSGSHSNSLVPLFAKGAGSGRFADQILGTEPNLRAFYDLDAAWTGQYVDNTAIFTVMSEAVNEPPVLTAPAAPPWWMAPELQNRQAFATVDLAPHYWCQDESDQFLFVTPAAAGAGNPAYLYRIPALVTAHTDNVVTPVAAVATATELGVSHLRGGAVSDELGRVLTGTSVPSDPLHPVYASLPTDGTAWNSSSVARITNDRNVIHDSMVFSHDSTQLFSNNYGATAKRHHVYTWTVGDLSHDGVGLTLAHTLASTHVGRIRSLSSYYIGGRDLVYYGEGDGGAKVVVYDPAAGTETVLLAGLTGGDITYVKVSGAGTGQSYLYVGAEAAPLPGNPSISVYKLAADGKSVDPTPVASFAGAALMTGILGVAPNYNRAFQVTSDGQFAFFGTHAAANVYTVSADAPVQYTTPEEVTITFDAEATDGDVPAQTLTFSLVGAPNGAAIGPESGVFTWTPTEAQGPGDYPFTVRVSDAFAADQRRVTLRVLEVNDAPAGTDKTVTMAEDAPYVLAAADFGFTDPNDIPVNAFSRVKITALPAAGSLKLNGVAMTSPGTLVSVADLHAGKLTYHPAANGSGPPSDDFPFQVEDDGGTAGGGVNLDPTPNVLTINVRPLIVTALTPTPSGFVAQFNGELLLDGLNLYDGAGGTLGPPDVTLKDGSGETVAGSIVVADNRQAIEFVKTGGALPPSTYAVILRSGATAFRALHGGLLDGNNDGTAGDDFTCQFTVTASSDRVVSIPDVARGAGQSVNIPNAAAGLPIRLSDAAGVRSLAVDLVYDQDLLRITAATLAASLPGDWSVVLDASTPGVAKIRAFGTTPLTGTNVEMVRLAAAVPSTVAYSAVQAIRLENVSLNSGGIAAVGDVAVHKAAYLGDTDGSGVHSSADAFLVVQAALRLASGFAAHAWTDPRIVGDCDGSGVLSAADAFLIVQEGLGLSEPFVPDNPHIGITPVGGGIDPQFQIGVNLPARAGGVVTVPVKLDIEAAASNVGGFDFDLFFDPSRLTIQLPTGVSAGADTTGWAVSAILSAPGQLRVGMVSSNGQPLAVGLREISRLQFGVEVSRTGWQPVRDGLPTCPTWLDIEPVDRRAGGYGWTDADGSLLIRPAVRALAGATRERIWRDVDAKADLLESVLADLAHDAASVRR